MAPSGILRPGKYVAPPALTEPLILSDDSSEEEDFLEDEEEEASSYSSEPSILLESMSRKDIISTLAVSLLVSGGLAASAAAIIAIPSAIVVLMGGICILNSPVVAHKHLRVAKSAGVRASVNMIREEINVLKGEIAFVAQAVDDLQSEADVLVGLEQDLRNISRKQGVTVAHVVDLVNENELILSKIKANFRQTFVSIMTAIVIRSENGEMKIDLKELPVLSLRLQIQLEPYGIKLDTSKFVNMIKEDNDISNVLKFLGNMLFEGDPDNNSDDDNSADSQLTFDFESFCKTMAEEGDTKMTLAEKLSMVTADEKYSRGSVEVARGNRMAIVPHVSKKEDRRQTIVKEVKQRQTKLATQDSRRFSRNVLDTYVTIGRFGVARETSAEV